MTLAAIPDGFEPRGIWDPSDPENAYHRNWKACAAWANAFIPRPNDTYLAEFYLIDGPVAVLHRYARDERGRVVAGPDGEPAREERAVVALSELPPDHLMRP